MKAENSATPARTVNELRDDLASAGLTNTRYLHRGKAMGRRPLRRKTTLRFS